MRVIRHRLQSYPDSVAEQEALVARILAGEESNTLILTEHPPVYTIGTSGSEHDILRREVGGVQIDIMKSGRGGEVTYHGPGQIVCYVIADLREEKDLHRHVWRLEEMIIRTLAQFDLRACRNRRGIGVWVGELKIAAVGVRCRKWISYHGIALNHETNLGHYGGIVPCGMDDRPVTSMAAEGIRVAREEIEEAIVRQAEELFVCSPSHVRATG